MEGVDASFDDFLYTRAVASPLMEQYSKIKPEHPNDVLLYRPGDEPVSTEKLLGYHGGLTPDEVRIPLVLV